jgi:hypothetical protein
MRGSRSARASRRCCCLTSLLACFSTPLVPTAVAVSFALRPDVDVRAFGFYRAWGTVGYGVLVIGFPFLLDWLDRARGAPPRPGAPSEPALGAMFPATAALMLVAAAIAFALPRSSGLELRSARGDWRRLLAHRPTSDC